MRGLRDYPQKKIVVSEKFIIFSLKKLVKFFIYLKHWFCELGPWFLKITQNKTTSHFHH